MQVNKIFLLVLLVFISVNIAAVTAGDLNSTDKVQLVNDNPVELANDTIVKSTANDNESIGANSTVEKNTPAVSVSSKSVKSKDTLEIYLKNSTGNPLKYKKFTAVINNKKYSKLN